MNNWRCKIHHKWEQYDPGKVLVSSHVAAKIKTARLCRRCGILKFNDKAADRYYEQTRIKIDPSLDLNKELAKTDTSTDWWKQQ